MSTIVSRPSKVAVISRNTSSSHLLVIKSSQLYRVSGVLQADEAFSFYHRPPFTSRQGMILLVNIDLTKPKSQFLNPKQIRNTKSEIRNKFEYVKVFKFGVFVLRIYLEIRFLCLGFSLLYLDRLL